MPLRRLHAGRRITRKTQQKQLDDIVFDNHFLKAPCTKRKYEWLKWTTRFNPGKHKTLQLCVSKPLQSIIVSKAQLTQIALWGIFPEIHEKNSSFDRKQKQDCLASWFEVHRAQHKLLCGHGFWLNGWPQQPETKLPVISASESCLAMQTTQLFKANWGCFSCFRVRQLHAPPVTESQNANVTMQQRQQRTPKHCRQEQPETSPETVFDCFQFDQTREMLLKSKSPFNGFSQGSNNQERWGFDRVLSADLERRIPHKPATVLWLDELPKPLLRHDRFFHRR